MCLSSKEFINLPVIDISSFRKDGNRIEKRLVAKKINLACREVGFMYVANHGVDQDIIDAAFQATKEFFNLSLEEKQTVNARNNQLYRGYCSIEDGHHTCKKRSSPTKDKKESFTIGATCTDPDECTPLHGLNQWPDEKKLQLLDWQKSVNTYWNSMLELSRIVARGLALSLDLNEEFFEDKLQNPCAQMVLLKYHQREKAARREEHVGCRAHTDFGFLTILAQDGSRGLEIRNNRGEWISASPVPGTFIVNLGDMASKWTGSFYKSTLHRVYNDSYTTPRYSIPFFCNCDFNTPLRVLTKLGSLEDEQNEQVITAGEYVMNKLGVSF